jgi:hypothetical protein
MDPYAISGRRHSGSDGKLESSHVVFNELFVAARAERRGPIMFPRFGLHELLLGAVYFRVDVHGFQGKVEVLDEEDEGCD